MATGDLFSDFARTYEARRQTEMSLEEYLKGCRGDPMMYASALYLGAFDGMDASTRDLFRWLGLLVASPVVLYAARPFFAGAWRALRARHLSMDVPVSLALALIYAASVVEAVRGGREVYFDSVSMFVFFLLLGRQLEMHARHRAGDLGDALARLTPVFAERILADGSTERIAAAELHPGDHVRVASGLAVPADGVLVGAACRVDEALLSGESAPVARRELRGYLRCRRRSTTRRVCCVRLLRESLRVMGNGISCWIRWKCCSRPHRWWSTHAATSRAPRELPARRTAATASGSSGGSDPYVSTAMPEVDDMALFNDAFGQPGSRQR